MSLRFLLAAGAVAALALTASCAPRRPAPALPPPPPAAPLPQPPTPTPPSLSWQEAPLSPGDWTWRDEAGVSSAAFGAGASPLFVMRCDPGRAIILVRAGASGSALSLFTSFAEHILPGSLEPDGVTVRLAPSDPKLDEIVFSRGRFAIGAPGTERLILPAWPEPARVIEDCRG